MRRLGETVKNLRDFAIEHARSTMPELRRWVQKNAETAASLLYQVAFGFRPRRHPAKTVIPEVARAELAAAPLPGWLWDDVLEPLLAMAEGAAGGSADERLEEAICRLREVTRQPDAAAAVICGVRAAQAMDPLMELADAGTYEVASESMAQAFQALRAAYDDHRERDRDLLESCTDHTAWIGRFSTRLLSNLNTLLEIRELAGNPQTDSELLAQLRKLKSAMPALKKLRRATGATGGEEALVRAQACVDCVYLLRQAYELPEGGDLAQLIAAVAGIAENDHATILELRELSGLGDTAARTCNAFANAKLAQKVGPALELLQRLERSIGWPEGDPRGLAETLIECWQDRDRLAQAAAELVKAWDDEEEDLELTRSQAAATELRSAVAASPVASAFGKGGGRLESQPVPGVPARMGELVSREIEQQEAGDAATSTFSAELEAFREGSYRTQLVAWMERIERRVAIVFEMAGGREQVAAPAACAGGDKAIEQAQPWCAATETDRGDVLDVLKLDAGDPVDHHAVAALEAVPALVDHVTRLEQELAKARADDDATVRVWDEHSEAICAALGPYYSDPDGGYDYDEMVSGIERLRKYAEELTDALFRLVTVIRDGGTPARIAAAGVLSPATWAGKLDNALKLADAALSSRDVPQQTPDPAQGA